VTNAMVRAARRAVSGLRNRRFIPRLEAGGEAVAPPAGVVMVDLLTIGLI
jgi:hypothetical protein